MSSLSSIYGTKWGRDGAPAPPSLWPTQHPPWHRQPTSPPASGTESQVMAWPQVAQRARWQARARGSGCSPGPQHPHHHPDRALGTPC